jgi:D-alanine-D-alanine ligase
VLLERHVDGRDLAVSILDGQALPIVEAVPVGGGEYDFEARYEIGRTDFVCPAQLSDEATARAQDLALAAYRLLGCDGFARVDIMCDRETGEQQLLEVNPVPGLTETSLLPRPPTRRASRSTRSSSGWSSWRSSAAPRPPELVPSPARPRGSPRG